MNILKKAGQFIVLFIITLLISFVFTIGLFMLFSFLPSLFQPLNTIFWVSNGAIHFVFLLEVFLVLICFQVLSRLFKFPYAIEKLTKFLDIIKKYSYISFFIFMFLFYAVVIDTTFITSENIVVKRVFSPVGKVYSYSDVIGVSTGIYGSRDSLFMDGTGSFYYNIILKDGIQIGLSELSGANAKDYDVYELIEDFDHKVMKGSNVVKISSEDSLVYCDFDKQYKDCLERIILNK